VEALGPESLPVLGYRLNEIARSAAAEHLVLCGHATRISGRLDCDADLFERACNRVFEVTEQFRTQSRGIRFLSADEEQATSNDDDKESEANESDPFVELRRCLVERERGENEQPRENDPQRGVDGVHSPRLVGVRAKQDSKQRDAFEVSPQPLASRVNEAAFRDVVGIERHCADEVMQKRRESH
jgi:hypothetical protein